MLRLNSIPENVLHVEALVSELRQQHGFTDSNYWDILIALTEAVNNAIYHGNKCNPDKYFSLSYSVTDENICFTVSDEGLGFDPNCLPDPTAKNCVEHPNGRGVFLMKKLSNQISFTDNGRTIAMWFSI